MENAGFPASANSAFSWAIRMNWASRSGLWPPSRTLAILCSANPSSSNQSRTTGGLTGVPMSVTASAIRRGERSVHNTSSSSGSPAVLTSSTDFRFCSSSGSDSTFFSTSPRTPHPSLGGIFRQQPKFDSSTHDSPCRALQDASDVLDTTATQPGGFKGREPSLVLLGQCFPKPPHPLFDIRLVPLLKYKSHPWPPGPYRSEPLILKLPPKLLHYANRWFRASH